MSEVYPRKPKQISLHVYPLLWNLLGANSGQSGGSGAQVTAPAGVTGPMRNAAIALARSLYEMQGDDLLTFARSAASVTPRMIHLLNELLSS